MPNPSISNVKAGTCPYLPASAQNIDFPNAFVISFDVEVPEKGCHEWEIRVEVWEEDEFYNPDELVTGSPNRAGQCYTLKPGTYHFFIGDIQPNGRALPAGTDSAETLHASGPLSPGNIRLPDWMPWSLDDDPGYEYEMYYRIRLIPCGECGDGAQEITYVTSTTGATIYGGPDWMETWGKRIIEVAKAAGAFIPAPK